MKKIDTTAILLFVLFVAAIAAMWKPWAPNEPMINLGLDLKGGLRVVLQTDNPNPDPDDLEKARLVIENRINGLGVAEPLIQIAQPNRIVVELPGLSPEEQDKALKLIGQQAVLEFRIVKQEAQGKATSELTLDDLGPVELKGSDLVDARVQFDRFNRPEVALEFTPEGAKKFADLTRNNIGRRLAIVLDGTIYSAPNIQTAITDGRAVITGINDLDEATQIALVLRSGSLPVPLHVEEVRAIGPTLGKDAIRAGIVASIVGALLIFVLLFLYYGFWFGSVAAIGLLYIALLIMGVLSGLGAVLTLPGIAGFILTLGAAVDGNVLSFERIKEELKLGKKLRQAIPDGFVHSTVTILDANISTLLAAAALYQYSTGPVRGFAVMLAIGIVVAVFSNLVFSRWMLEKIAAAREVIPPYWIWGTKIPFLKEARIFTPATLAFAVLMGVVVFFNGFNFGIDFTGGTAYLVRTGPEVSVDRIRSFLDEVQIQGVSAKEAIITEVESPLADYKEFSVRVGLLSNDGVIALRKAFEEKLNAEVLQSEVVGPAVGAELRRNTVLAVLVGLGLILIYMAFRFDWIFGVASVIAVGHDVAITAGAFSLLGLEFTIPIVAALLTIIGYSINDSIIVSDRIRENQKVVRGVPYNELVDLSINQTLSRTVMTSFTTMLPLFALLFIGGPVLRDFSIALLIGILVGTFSSIYVVGSLVTWWKMRQPAPRKKART
ncbi:protein translocase subunit SecD [Oceanithermus desulfurans]|uniref:Multifunctional fusion protein n=2 Tax=Oceanithermus desulfurans TaxID=227924 RepID=A0A511RIR3_9DEIN|nr:protein translocase subunit SecD [Oceanithermus desulfurans]MBB6028930.1 SecD/SecF fusion protein [Oceanithermus desulfurans]GEM88987.1 protein translocase subunit SecDF [Oceanithermus desulfurans NBRC 100063]